MTMIFVRKNEPLERALKRFKKKVDKEGIMRTLRERQRYDKPSDKRRKKASIARSKMRRETLKVF